MKPLIGIPAHPTLFERNHSIIQSCGQNYIESVEKEIRHSLQIARQRHDPVTPFIVEKAQIDDDDVIKSHIAMFVNDFSENVGEAGFRALENLWRLSHC